MPLLTITPRTIKSGEIIHGRIDFTGPVPADQDEKNRLDGQFDGYKKRILSTPQLLEFKEVQGRRAKAESELAEAKERIEKLKRKIEKAAIAGENDSKLQADLAKTIASLVGLEARLKGIEGILAEKRNGAYLACRDVAKQYGPALMKEIRDRQKAALQKANEALVDILSAHMARIDTISGYMNHDLSSTGGCEKYLTGLGIRTNS